MRGTAASLEALAPRVALVIGGETVHSRPISAECARWFDVGAASADPAARGLAILGVLRAAFPARYALRAVLDLPATVQRALLAQLLAVPGSHTRDTADDIVDRIIASHRAVVHGQAAASRTVTKETITRLAQLHYGADWYFNPRRWPTVDGYVPWAECVIAYEYLTVERAQQRLSDFAALCLARGGKEVTRLYNDTAKDANPMEA